MDLKKPISICIISNIRSAHIARWLTILSVRGFNISVISNEPPKGHIPHVNIFECLSRAYRFILFRYLHELYRAIKIRCILNHLRPDIVHIHSFDYIHPLMIALVDYFLGGFPNLIVSTWGTDVIGIHGISSSRRGELSKRFLLSQAKEITATTHFLADATSKLAPKSRKIHVIPFGIDCELFSRSANHRKPQKGFIRLGFIKHLNPKYGPDFLIKAMPSVLSEFPNTLLVLVGQGEMEYELKSLSAHLGIEKHVQFLGHVEYESVPAVLQSIDIFVMPSVQESFGVASIEAQSMEIPVVATNVGGVPEAVVNGHTGILVEPRNVGQLADAIKKLIANPTLRVRMGKNARQFVLDNYRIEDNVLLFEDLFEKLLKNSR